MPSARGEVMPLQTGTFEIGWVLGAAATGGASVAAGGYPIVYAAFGLLLPVSLLFLWFSR